MVFILLNRNFYKITVKDVHRTNVPPLAFRSIQGTIVNVINFACSKSLPLSIIGIVNNMAPVVTVGLAYIFLGERLKLLEMIFLMLSVGGILTIIIGGFGQGTDSSYVTITQAPWLYSGLFTNPFLTGGGSIALRKMKSLHEMTVSWYLNATMMITSLIFVLAL